MKVFYFLVKLNDKPFNVFNTYFVKNGGFTRAFVIALVVAVVAIALFYLLFGFSMKRCCKKSVWVVTLVAAMLTSFFCTGATTGLKARGDKPADGLRPALEYRWGQSGQEEDKPAYQNMKDQFSKGFLKVKQTRNLALMNAVYAGLFFFLISILMNAILPKSNYAKAIIFRI